MLRQSPRLSPFLKTRRRNRLPMANNQPIREAADQWLTVDAQSHTL